MNASNPQVIARGIPSRANATESNTATIRPNTVVTNRYWRVPQANRPNACDTRGRSAAIDATRSPAPPLSTLRNNNNANRNTRFDARPATLPSTAPNTPANFPRFNELAACCNCSGPTPNDANFAVAEATNPSAFDAYCGNSVARRATEYTMPNARTTRMPYTNTITASVVAHPGQPRRRNHPAAGATAITTINAMKAGPINHAIACTPATTTTAAAAPTRITSARGNPRPVPA